MTCLSSPNLNQNGLRGGREYLVSIDGHLCITVEGFTMQVLGKCDVAYRLMPIADGVGSSEQKAFTASLLKAVH